MEHFESFRYFVMFIIPHLSFRDFARVTPAPFPWSRTYRDFTCPYPRPPLKSTCIFGMQKQPEIEKQPHGSSRLAEPWDCIVLLLYSLYLSASIGGFPAALFAGYKPKISPMSEEKTIAMTATPGLIV